MFGKIWKCGVICRVFFWLCVSHNDFLTFRLLFKDKLFIIRLSFYYLLQSFYFVLVHIYLKCETVIKFICLAIFVQTSYKIVLFKAFVLVLKYTIILFVLLRSFVKAQSSCTYYLYDFK